MGKASKDLIIGILATVIGGVILAIIVGEGRFAPSPTIQETYEVTWVKPTIDSVYQPVPDSLYEWQGDLPFLADAYDLAPLRYDEEHNEVTVGYKSNIDQDEAREFYKMRFDELGYELVKTEPAKIQDGDVYPERLYFSPERTRIEMLAWMDFGNIYLEVNIVRSLDSNCTLELFANGDCPWEASYRSAE